jgi:4a-hydroxytetrahydrobiopterin dehydratase
LEDEANIFGNKDSPMVQQQCKLSEKTCVPCRGGVPPLKGEKLSVLYKQLKKGWKVVDEHHLEKEYSFPDFRTALAFTNRVGELAEQEGHHPDILLSYGKVKISLWTHKIDGLTESDFILAAKCDEL